MRWIRANRRGGAALALIALAIQFALALGHIHAPLGVASATIVASQSTNASPPDDGLPQRQTDANCDLCAVLHMAGTGQIAAAPSLILPLRFAATERTVAAEPAITRARHILAQSRAPPQV
jgi:hypothetical protein